MHGGRGRENEREREKRETRVGSRTIYEENTGLNKSGVWGLRCASCHDPQDGVGRSAEKERSKMVNFHIGYFLRISHQPQPPQFVYNTGFFELAFLSSSLFFLPVHGLYACFVCV
jgi:hypothetical protein